MESLTLIAAGVLQGIGMSITIIIFMYVAEAINDKKAAKRKEEETKRHERTKKPIN
jgi:hypothetical protein